MYLAQNTRTIVRLQIVRFFEIVQAGYLSFLNCYSFQVCLLNASL